MRRIFVALLAAVLLFGGVWNNALAVAEDTGSGDAPEGEKCCYGDADRDEVVNAKDAMLTLQFYTQTVGEEILDSEACDVDGSGTVNAKDAMLILQYYTQMIRYFPVEKPDLSAWNLLLVNYCNPVPDGFTVNLKKIQNGHAVDARVYSDLQEMMDAMRAEGLSPVICSSYRTQADQEKLFANRIKRYIDDGYTQEEAEALAPKSVAYPGTSEHQLGLAVDIVDKSYQLLGPGQEKTAVQQWLIQNCWQYGFILRYPNGKTSITGVYYEPWHYRYVGREVSMAIFDAGICFEEYLAQFQE